MSKIKSIKVMNVKGTRVVIKEYRNDTFSQVRFSLWVTLGIVILIGLARLL